jgi:hypothetical protein
VARRDGVESAASGGSEGRDGGVRVGRENSQIFIVLNCELGGSATSLPRL